MKSENKEKIQKAFTEQASKFASNKMNFNKQEYVDYTISKMKLQKTDHVLEMAAGTCICGRAIAPHVKHVTCLDMTPAMISIGKNTAEKENLDNMTFVLGDSRELPFLDDSFDIVFSRLAFHHFPDIEQPFKEMKRVLKPGGKLIIIDMEATNEQLRQVEDEIEILRDPSHVKNISKDEFLDLYEKNGLNVELCEATKIPVILDNWLEHTKTPEDIQKTIIAKMQEDIKGGTKTGFYPYYEKDSIKFDQRWMMIVGK